MKKKVYAQVYSIIKMSQDGLIEAVQALAKDGYDGIQTIGTNTGGLGVDGFKALLDDLGLDVIASHGLHTDEELEFGKKLGIRYADLSVRMGKTADEIKTAAEELNKIGKHYQELGVCGILHQHAEEFLPIPGTDVCPYDLLLEYTDPDYVGFELDIGWAKRAGASPEEYIRKYAGRFPVLHAKECCEVSPDVGGMLHFPPQMLELGPPTIVNGAPQWKPEQLQIVYESRSWNGAMGQGLIDWKAVVDAAEAQGCVAYISEREYYHIPGVPDGDVFKCAELDYQWLRSLGL